MYEKLTHSWIKHLDFELVDIICMECSFFLAYALRHRNIPNYANSLYFKMGMNMLIIDILVVFFLQNYKGILTRNKWQECIATFRHVTIVQILFLMYEYLIKEAELLSRFVFFLSWLLSLCLCYFVRCIWKTYIRKKITIEQFQKRILVLSSEENIERCLQELYTKEYREFEVICIAFLEGSKEVANFIKDIPVIYGKEPLVNYIRQEVVDEVLIDHFCDKEELEEWVNLFLSVGVTIHISLGFLPDNLSNKFVEKIGACYVVTSSIKIADSWEIICKRLMDIVGSLVGLVLTGIAYIFVAPAIKIASPGPVFFKQARVGKNGRIFNIYKFRSMYMDAEERKKELMEYNEMQGLMFKMENDPRIIGSEKGPGRGIGNFIRRTSIDELPQFWNILKGDMSLVGTRPPTVNEYEQYDLHHKIRLSAKPGLTGMWQVSGRSDIKNFEDVVKLDIEYIENWSLKLDVKLILKTIKVVLNRKGSK